MGKGGGCAASAPASAPAPEPAAGGAPESDKKLIVMSCPEMGTLDPYENGPYDVNVMDKIEEMSKVGKVKMGFDRAGTSTTSPKDKDVDWTEKEQVRASEWMYGFKTAAKAIIKTESQGFSGLLQIICINGGIITTVEAEEMQKIVNNAKKDAAKSHVKVRIQLSTMSYYDFLQEYDKPALALVQFDQHQEHSDALIAGGKKEQTMVAVVNGGRRRKMLWGIGGFVLLLVIVVMAGFIDSDGVGESGDMVDCSVGSGDHYIEHGGYTWRTLDSADPAGPISGAPNGGCQRIGSCGGGCTDGEPNFLPLPAGWMVAPNDAASDSVAVIAAHGWSTACAVLADGTAWASIAHSWRDAGDQCGVYGVHGGASTLVESNDTYTVKECRFRVLARCG